MVPCVALLNVLCWRVAAHATPVLGTLDLHQKRYGVMMCDAVMCGAMAAPFVSALCCFMCWHGM